MDTPESASWEEQLAKFDKLRSQGRLAEAEGHLIDLLAIAPRDVPTLFRAYLLAEEMGDQDRALEWLETAAHYHPANLVIRCRIVSSLRSYGRLAEAEAAFEDLMQQHPRHPRALIEGGRLYRLMNNHGRALDYFRAAVARGQRGDLVQLDIAGELQSLGNSEEAGRILEDVITNDPKNYDAIVRLAHLYSALNRNGEAKQNYLRARVLKPDEVKPWLGLVALQQREDTTLVLPLIEQALKAAGPHAELLHLRAVHLLNRGFEQEALDEIDAAIALFPDDPMLKERAVRLSLRAGRIIAAGKSASHLDLDRIHGRITRLLVDGALHEAAMDMERALASHHAILSIDPNHEVALNSIARLHILRLEPDRALATRRRSNLARRGRLALQGRSLNASQGLLGEIANDLRTDQAGLSRARDAMVKGDLPAMLALVRARPGYTGGAIGLLLMLAGLRKERRASSPESRRSIPKQILQYWDTGEPPADVEDLMASWTTQNPGWGYARFSDKEATAFLARLGDPMVHKAYRLAGRPARKADILRLAVLYQHGGVYADADDRCVANLDALTDGHDLVLWHEQYGTVGNNFIAARPGHPIIGAALAQAVTSTLRGDSDSLWCATGPGAVSRAAALYFAEDPNRIDELGSKIALVDRYTMRQFCVPCCATTYKSGTQHWVRSDFFRKTAEG